MLIWFVSLAQSPDEVLPTALMAVMTTIRIRASMTAYSTAVAAFSSLPSLISVFEHGESPLEYPGSSLVAGTPAG